MLILCFLLLFNINTFIVHASNETYFARVMYEQVYLYKSPVDDNSQANIMFELPKTYFVELTENCNNIFYKAIYQNITGYVKKDSVQAIEGTPINPYLNNLNFRVYAELSQDLRSAPNSTSSNQIAHIPLLCRNLTFIGKIEGESLIAGRTSTWFYCKYTADVDYYGYVYSDFCDELPQTLPSNTENVIYTSNPDFKLETQQTIPQNSNTVGVIVAILTIPAIIFLLMIIKGKKILTNTSFSDKEIMDY